jgi:hypothetical protein
MNNSMAPQPPWRSEAFAEDLFGDGPDGLFAEADSSRPHWTSTLLFLAVPAVVALLGGVAAFWNTVG